MITGIVTAAPSGGVLASTAVHVWSAADSVLVAQTMTNAEGAFRIEQLAAGAYYLRLVHLNGVATTAVFELLDAETRNLGALQVPITAVTLAPIEVSAERVAVTFEPGRTSYIVGLMPGAEGASMTDVMRSIPEMTVDIDGHMVRRGREPAIYINDRPAPMSREALALFLEQFPADHIQKIEVIDNPSARYRADGGSIINIVLKQGADLGTSGGASVQAGTRGEYGIGTQGTLQRGRWTVDGNGSLNLSSLETTGFDLRQNLVAEPAFLRQDSWSDGSGLSGNLYLNARYERSERLRFFAQGRLSPSRNTSRGLTTTTHLNDVASPILVYDRSSDTDFRNLSADVMTGFEYEWDPRGHRIKVDLSLSRGTRSTGSREEITGDADLDPDVPLPAKLTLVDEDNGDDGAWLNVDYTRPWGEDGTIELGFQSIWNNSDNDRSIRLIGDSLPVLAADDRTDWNFEQQQRSSSIYTTLQRQLGRLAIQAGVRAEHADLRFTTAGGDPFGRRYFDLFPSAGISYRLDDARQLDLSYSKRIARPDPAVLDPTDRSTDPLSRIVGNADITPQYTHSIALAASWSGSLGNLGLSSHYNRTTNEWAMITTVDDDGVSTRTFQNLASSTSYGASLTYSMQRRNGWGGQLSLSGARDVRDADNLAEHYSGSSFNWSAHATVSARVAEALDADGMFSYTPPIDLPQGRQSGASYTADFGVRYRLLDNRASVRLALQDPFGLMESSSQLQDSTYIQIGRSRESTRSAQLQVSYTLGGPGGMRRMR